jgi:hypothetical protein
MNGVHKHWEQVSLAQLFGFYNGEGMWRWRCDVMSACFLNITVGSQSRIQIAERRNLIR